MALIKCSECGKEISDQAKACPFCGCPLSLMDTIITPKSTSDEIAAENSNKKKKAKCWIAISSITVLLFVISIVVIALLPSRYNWDKILLSKALPEPTSKYGNLYTNESDDLYLSVEKVSFAEYETYLSNCIKMGYTYVIESNTTSYAAFNDDGNELRLNYYEYNQILDICLDVRVTGVIKWSTKEIAIGLPIPSSKIGSVINNYDEHYEVYIGETSKDEYSAYILECETNGFCINTKKSDCIFSAENDFGYILSVEYFECDMMHIDVHISSETNGQNNLDETNNETSNENPDTDGSYKEKITLSEAKSIYENVFDGWNTLIDDFIALLDQDTFTSIEEINKYEDQWMELSDTSYNLANELLINTPPEEVATEWNAFADKLMEIGSILFTHSTMDANLDNHYDGEEMTSVIESARTKFVAVGEEIAEISKSFVSKTEDVDVPSSGNGSSSNSHKCEECGKSAPYSYISPFSGEKEYYCKTHYDKLMDMLENMGLQ